jgi:hypothetical protein
MVLLIWPPRHHFRIPRKCPTVPAMTKPLSIYDRIDHTKGSKFENRSASKILVAVCIRYAPWEDSNFDVPEPDRDAPVLDVAWGATTSAGPKEKIILPERQCGLRQRHKIRDWRMFKEMIFTFHIKVRIRYGQPRSPVEPMCRDDASGDRKKLATIVFAVRFGLRGAAQPDIMIFMVPCGPASLTPSVTVPVIAVTSSTFPPQRMTYS